MNANRIENICTLTPAQEGIYAQIFKNPQKDTYQLYYLFSLAEDTDPTLLRRAFVLLGIRHPVLRSAFAVVRSAVKQVILSDRLPEVKEISFDSPYSEEILTAAVAKEKRTIPDLQKDSLVRFVFFFFRDRRFLFFQTHHLILDGWCASLLFDDLTRCYQQLKTGRPETEIADFLKRERDAHISFGEYTALLRRLDATRAKSHWKALLDSAAPTPLAKGNRKKTLGTEPRAMAFSLSEATVSRARVLCSDAGITLNSLLESVFALTLQKHTGNGNALFGKVVSGRSFVTTSVEHTAGCMINTVPVWAARSAGDTPLSFLQKMHEQSVNANELGFLPFSDVCKENGIIPDNVDVLFDFGNFLTVKPNDRLPLHFLRHSEQTEFPLTVVISPEGNGLFVQIAYYPFVFQETAISALKNSFCSILEKYLWFSLAEMDDENSFLDLTALTPNEQALLFSSFYNGGTAEIPEKSLYELFVKQSCLVPEKPALVCGEKTLSFSDLLRITDATADRLFSLGIKKGNVAAIRLEKTEWLFIFQLALLKLGAVFFPTDKRFPLARVQRLCADCSVKILICDDRIKPTVQGVTVMTPEEIARIVPICSCTEEPGETAYIICTSGTTGIPKGCILKQKSLVNFCVNNNTLPFLKKTENTVFACVNSVAFDYFIAESLFPLLNGFSVVLFDENDSLLKDRFLSRAERFGVNVLMTTPTRLALFYEGDEHGTVLQKFALVCSSGEALPETLLEKIRALSPNAEIFNPLGPSECTVWDLGGHLSPENKGDVHLGRPIPNTRAYVLDSFLRPVPIGTPGELCLAGCGVGGGYIGDSVLTDTKFPDDPFGEGKLYRTGDLVCLRFDGNYSFLGRIDTQLKLRGLRIEAGEIETALTASEGIDLAAVVIKESGEEQILTAFYIGEDISSEYLREKLSELFPSYMIPQVFIHLSTMPLTITGKIDRNALASKYNDCLLTLPGNDPPQNETEREICQLFGKVLNTKNVGRNSDFQLLGGSSLQVVRLLSIPPLNVLSPTEFMANPTPAGLAKRLSTETKTKAGFLIPLYTPTNPRKTIVLFPYAGGDATAYTRLIAEARKTGVDSAFSFVDWPRRAEDLNAVEEEIRHLAQTAKVEFYSHCAGAAIALQLLDRLNSESRLIGRYFAGANLPPPNSSTQVNLWVHTPDRIILSKLKKAGLQFEEDDKVLLQNRLDCFRKNTQFSVDFFRNKTGQTEVPTIVILNKNDPFTKEYDKARERWQNLVTQVDAVYLFDTFGHYFQDTEASDLLKLLSK